MTLLDGIVLFFTQPLRGTSDMFGFKKRVVSERPCKVEGCNSPIFLSEKEGWICVKKHPQQGEYGSK